jgi:hypothetical protein
MIEGELKVISSAWECQKAAGIESVPVPIEKYLQVVKAECQVRFDLNPDEAGQCFRLGSRRIIWVNGNHSPERQRFTVLHEIAHLHLDLPSKHGRHLSVSELLGYSRRPREEILCDIFAAECLFPRAHFSRDIAAHECGMEAIRGLAERYGASLTATASRFAAYSKEPCASALADQGRVRYVSYSPPLRDMRFWIAPGIEVPSNSVLGRLLADARSVTRDIIPHHLWTNNECPALGDLCEESVLIPSIGQGLSLMWAEETDSPGSRTRKDPDADEELLAELDGQLHFHKRTRRR